MTQILRHLLEKQHELRNFSKKKADSGGTQVGLNPMSLLSGQALFSTEPPKQLKWMG